MNNKAPRLVKDHNGRFYVIYYLKGKRHRTSSGKELGINISPNRFPITERDQAASRLVLKIHEMLVNGIPNDSINNQNLYELVNSFELGEHYKDTYKKAFSITYNRFKGYILDRGWNRLSIDKLKPSDIIEFLNSKDITPASFNTERKHLSSMFTKLLAPLHLNSPMETVNKMKEKPTLHKPFKDVNLLLEDIKSFNENLFLCCLLTYGCLLRPHQEIRNLKWGDFSEDMKHISLSGKRNKSGRNRIVPIPEYIFKHLHKGLDTDNIFTGSEKPYNGGYFKTLWRRYKAQSNVLEDLQTLYSFRHSGAIEIYKRTGSVTILQSAMGHASLAVTLGYLRGLEIPSLKLEDMPRL